jgi:hypothetical protein
VNILVELGFEKLNGVEVGLVGVAVETRGKGAGRALEGVASILSPRCCCGLTDFDGVILPVEGVNMSKRPRTWPFL